MVEETKSLIEKYGDRASPLQSLGYRQATQYLKGEADFRSAIQSAQQAHRNYAKRQMTWFRREREVSWLTGFGDDPDVQQEALTIIKSTL
jgi:tRNA dimethylallyltransferase